MTPKTIHWRDIKYHWEIYLFVVPTLLLIAIFQYYPAASGVFHSFFRWNGADISEYVGWDNFTDLVSDSSFWNSFQVAFLLGVANVIKMIPALVVAICIHRCRNERMQFFYRIMFVIPMVIPPLVIALIWRSFFFEATSGYLNQFLNLPFLMGASLMDALHYLDAHTPLLRWIGCDEVFSPGRSPAWLGDPKLILTSCIVWGFPWVGSFAVLTHLAKLQGISKDIYEAADIDGVNWWTKCTQIELPLIKGSIHLLLVFVIIETIKDAGMILALAGLEGGPGGKATVPALFMIRKAFLDQKMGYACAVGIVLTIIVMSLQKSSNVLIEWSNLGAKHQRRMRLGLFGLAGLLVLCGNLMSFKGLAPDAAWLQAALSRCAGFSDVVGKFAWLSIVLVAVALPYGRIADAFRYAFRRLKDRISRRSEEHALRYDAEGLRRLREKEAGALGDLTRKAQEHFLRFAKHATVWAVLAFALLPLYLMIIVSIKNNQQFYEAPARITEPYFWGNWVYAWVQINPTLANSVFVATLSTALTLVFALCGAYFFARVKMPLSTFFWNAFLILMMMPTIANLVPLFCLLRDINLLNTLTALIIVGASGGQVFAIFVLRNFIQDIPQDLFEAAEIDGASHFQQMRTIVLPLSGPILGTVGVMHFISQWNDFVLPLIIIRDHARLPVTVQLLRMSGEYIKLWGPLMAGYALASIPVIILFVFSMKLFVRGLTEGAVKG